MLDQPKGAPAGTRPRVQSAARTIGILVAVAQSENGLTPREISEQLGIGRQATYHLLHTLHEADMLTRDERKRYLLGLRVGTLAEGFARQLAPSEHLAPRVRALARQKGETAYASGWWSGEIIVLSVARGTSPVQAAEVAQGQAGDAHARASGKLLLAHAAPDALDAYLSSHELMRLTPKTITSRDALERNLELIREQGYAVDDEEFAPGLCCLALPFEAGHSSLALALSAPRERFHDQRERYLEAMREIVSAPASAVTA